MVDGAQGTGRHKPELRRDFRSNRASTVHTATTAAVQQHYKRISASNSCLCERHRPSMSARACSVHQEIHAVIITFFGPRTNNCKIRHTSPNLHLPQYTAVTPDDAPSPFPTCDTPENSRQPRCEEEMCTIRMFATYHTKLCSVGNV